jgi:hypothetical protein
VAAVATSKIPSHLGARAADLVVGDLVRIDERSPLTLVVSVESDGEAIRLGADDGAVADLRVGRRVRRYRQDA